MTVRTNQSAQDLFSALEDRAARRFDVLGSEASMGADVETVVLDDEGKMASKAVLVIPDKDDPDAEPKRLGWTTSAGAQIAQTHGIPVRYFRKLEDDLHAAELARHLGYYLDGSDKTRLVRCMTDATTGTGYVRAYLSNRYRILDNEDVVKTALLAALGKAKERQAEGKDAKPEVFCWNLTDDVLDLLICDTALVKTFPVAKAHGLNVKAESWKTGQTKLAGTMMDQNYDSGMGGGLRMATAEGRDGTRSYSDDEDGGRPVFPGVHIRNSETGKGKLKARICLLDAVCSNRWIIGSDLAQVHLGRELSDDMVFSADLRTRENAIVWEKITEAVQAAFDEGRIDEMIRLALETQKVEIMSSRKAADLIVKKESWTEDQRDEILAAFAPQVHADRTTAFDMIQAITQAAQVFEAKDPETCLAMEETAGKIAAEGGKSAAAYFGAEWKTETVEA